MRSAAVVAARRPAYDVPRQRSSKAAFCRLAGLVTLTPGWCGLAHKQPRSHDQRSRTGEERRSCEVSGRG